MGGVRKPSGTNGRRRLRVRSSCRRASDRSGGNAGDEVSCGLPPDRYCGFWSLPVLVVELPRTHGSFMPCTPEKFTLGFPDVPLPFLIAISYCFLKQIPS